MSLLAAMLTATWVGNPAQAPRPPPDAVPSPASISSPEAVIPSVVAPPRVIHVLVALADNATQGIVPVLERLGNGDDPVRNLYWGARYGVKTFFLRLPAWELVASQNAVAPGVLERVILRHRSHRAFLVADAYRGAELRRALVTFLSAAAGGHVERVVVSAPGVPALLVGSSADLLVYVGHDGLMDFELDKPPTARDERRRQVMVLACASQQYFAAPLRAAGAEPLLWTTGLLAPEAYVLAAALDGWLSGEGGEPIRERAAAAYHQFQKCGLPAARRLFTTGW